MRNRAREDRNSRIAQKISLRYRIRTVGHSCEIVVSAVTQLVELGTVGVWTKLFAARLPAAWSNQLSEAFPHRGIYDLVRTLKSRPRGAVEAAGDDIAPDDLDPKTY